MNTGALKLDASAWPVVHGTRESLDHTTLVTPADNHLSFWNSQDQAGAFSHGQEGLTEMPSMEEVMDMLLHQKRGPFPPNFSMEDANPVSIISETVSDTEQRLWTSGFKNVQVFRQVHGKTGLELLARYDHGQFDFRFHGSYAFSASNSSATSFLVAMKDKLFRYSYVTEEQEPRIRAEAASLVPGVSPTEAADDAPLAAGNGDDDQSNYLVALTLSNDGTVLVASKGGNVTAIREEADSGRLVAIDNLPLIDHVQSDSIHISNSISVHEQGIYIVTQEELVRVDLDPDTQRLSFRWSTTYGPERPWYTSRLGPGSGSTPTITKCNGRQVVVITDGELDMGLIYYDSETGEELARTKVDFGPSVGRTTSEQSVAVRGCQAFVVNNYIGVDGVDDDVYCNYFQGPKVKQGLAKFCNSLQPDFIAKVCPAVFGCVGYGAAMYVLEQDAGSATGVNLRRQWGRDDITCGTSIPLISSTNLSAPSITYCVGMKRNESLWSLIGLDTDTGADVLSFPFYKERLPNLENFFANPYFAGVEAVGKGALAIGSIGGVNYLTSHASDPISAATPQGPAFLPTLSEPPSPSSQPTDPAHGQPSTHWYTQSPVRSLVGISAMLLLAVALVVARTRRVVSRLQTGVTGTTQPTGDGEQDGGHYHRLEGAPMELQAWELRQAGTGLLY